MIVPGFGTFRQKNRTARNAYNPHTGADVSVSARSELSFEASRLDA